MNQLKNQRTETRIHGNIAENRKARHNYFITDTYETGIILVGTEVKSLRNGRVNLSDSYAGPREGEIWLHNLYIGPYSHAPKKTQHEMKRPRKLLLHKRERNKLLGAVKKEGLTLIPLSLYFNARGICKLKLGLARGKQNVDKRHTIKERDWQRRKARVLRGDS